MMSRIRTMRNSMLRHIGFTLGCGLLAAGSATGAGKEGSRVFPGASWEQREPAQVGLTAAPL